MWAWEETGERKRESETGENLGRLTSGWYEGARENIEGTPGCAPNFLRVRGGGEVVRWMFCLSGRTRGNITYKEPKGLSCEDHLGKI